MKYLMIYEAFQAKVISDIVKYIKKDIGEKEMSAFLSELKLIQSAYDFPLTGIKPEDVVYTPAKKALKILPDDETNYYNDMKIFTVNFWFSLKSGYIGKTATGAFERDNSYFFTNNEIDKIKGELNIKRGELSKVVNYGSLRHGDYIILIIEGDLTLARVYIEGRKIYAIQDSHNGSEPDGNYRTFGRYSWSLGYPDDPNDDHKKLHLYKKEDVDFYYKEVNDNKNFKILSDGDVVDRSTFDITDNADFAVVLYLNDIFKRGFRRLSDVKKEREGEKTGAIGLLSNEDIKGQNLERYINKMIDNYGIKSESNIEDLKDLQKIILYIICDDYSFYQIFTRPIGVEILSLSRQIENFMKGGDNYSYSLDRIKKDYKKIKENHSYFKSAYRDSRKEIELLTESRPDVKNLFQMFDEISVMIKEYIESLNIDNLYQFNTVAHKIKLIENIFEDDLFNLSSNTTRVIRHFVYPEDMGYYMKTVLDQDDDLIKKDIKKMEYIIKSIKDILK